MRHLITFLLFLSFWTLSALAEPTSPSNQPTAEAPRDPAKIEFRIAEDEPAEGLVEATIDGTEEKIYLHKSAELTREDVAYALPLTTEVDGQFQPLIEVGFHKAGTKRIFELTQAHLGKRLAVIVDGRVISAPRIQDTISNKALITGNFSTAQSRDLAAAIACAPFRAGLLLIKADWSQVDAAETIETELREVLKGDSVPQTLLDSLPASGPEILFSTETISLYTPQHYADLLAWLRAKRLMVSVEAFPDGGFKSVPFARVYADGPDGRHSAAANMAPPYSASLERPMDFLDVPGERVEVLAGSEVPRPFVTKRVLFQWNIRETPLRTGKRKIHFERKIAVREAVRGQPGRDAVLLDASEFECEIPVGHVAITHAFPDDDEAQFRDAARRKGFLPLIVSVPAAAASMTAPDEGRVRPPDVITTLKTKYGGNEFWPEESSREAIANRDDMAKSAEDLLDQAALAAAIKHLREAYEASERAASEAAAELREQTARDADALQISHLRSRLKQDVAASFVLRVQLHELELAELERKLAKARETIDHRKRNQNQIIDRRIEEMLNPNWPRNLRNPVNANASADTSTTGDSPSSAPESFVQTIAGRWSIESCEIGGQSFKPKPPVAYDPFSGPAREVPASDQEEGAEQVLRNYATAMFGQDRVWLGLDSDDPNEPWIYTLEEQAEPRRITLTNGEKTIKGIVWAWKQEMVIALAIDGGDYPPAFDTEGSDHLVLRYSRDETDPAWLRHLVAELREIAARLLSQGSEGQHATARDFLGTADSWEREASLREQAQIAQAKAKELRKSGRNQDAAAQEQEADLLRARADEERAARTADQRVREQDQQFRERIRQTTLRAAALRNEGRFAEAEDVDRQIREMLRDRDPDLQRANELKQRAAQSRLDGKHQDVDLFEQQAQELLERIRQRYEGENISPCSQDTRQSFL